MSPFIAPLINIGATTPVRRRPATKVTVSQWPSGTYPIKRSPRGLRPFGRTMLVLTAVSSMNTNLAGSRSPCSRIQRRRARATSARCCSAARRLFFNGDVMTSEETPKRRTASTDSFLVHRRNDLIERQVRLISKKVEAQFRVLLKGGDAPSAWLGPGRSVRFPALHPSNRRTRAVLQLFGGLTPRRSRLHKSNDSNSHLTGIRSAHGPPPGESMRIESVPGRPLGIPDSPRPENPLGGCASRRGNMPDPLNVVVDISHHNGNVNLAKAKEDRILGVIQKATQGQTFKDPTYQRNRQKAKDAGLLWGAYHFATGSDGLKQAQHFLDVVGNDPETLLVLDFEPTPTGPSMNLEEAQAFATPITEERRRFPGFYWGHYITHFLGTSTTPLLTDSCFCPS